MKTKKLTGKIGKYFRDFSIVVAGIAVTLFVNDRVTNRSEKKDTAMYLNMVKLELEANKGTVDWWIDTMNKENNYARYLLNHDKKSLNADTLQYYSHVASSINSFYVSTNAFEMFKNSGYMRFIRDKDLLMSIWDAYSYLDFLQNTIEVYNKEKYEEEKKEANLRKERKPVIAVHYGFYTSEDCPASDLLSNCKKVKSRLEEVIGQMEKELD